MSPKANILEDRLSPLTALLDGADVEEVCVNRPGEAWIYTSSGGRLVAAPELTFDRIKSIATHVATQQSLFFDESFPRLSATLPNKDRLEILFPPIVGAGQVALAIRRQRLTYFTLDDLEERGMFVGTQIRKRERTRPIDRSEAMEEAAAKGDAAGLLRAAVQAKRNVVSAGPPGAGKTAILSALCDQIPHDERVITIEDVRELRTPQPNAVNLCLSFANQSVARLGPPQIMESILRLRPDRVILGECKGPETLVFFELVNTGSPGTITSVHANSTADAPWRLADIVHKYDPSQTKADLREHAESYVDVYVQVRRGRDARRVVEIAWL